MSVNFAVIRPVSQENISRKPTYSAGADASAPQAQPTASSPMEGGQPKKKSHWFRNTLVTLVVLVAGAALGQRYLGKTFDAAATIAKDAKWHEKGLHYAKFGVAKAGEFINKYVDLGINAVKGLFAGKGKTGTTTP